MNEGQLVVISSDEEDEVIITKKPKLEESAVANRDVFFTIKSVPGDEHWIVNCFSTFLNELPQEFDNNVEEYMKFGEYENSEQLLQCLQQYIFDKNYDHNTVDLVLEALSKIYKHRIFIFENSIDNPSCGFIGKKISKCIILIQRGDHCNLVVSSEKWKVWGVFFNFIKKETLTQVFPCEFCQISKNDFLHRTPLVAASGVNWSEYCCSHSFHILV